jgi:hypothetical protein
MGAGPANWSGSPWRDWRGRPPFCCGRARGETSAALEGCGFHLESTGGLWLPNDKVDSLHKKQYICSLIGRVGVLSS